MSLRPQSVFVACTPVLLALCAGAHPQSPPYSEVDNNVDLPQVTAAITRTCTGDIDGDFTTDVALLSGGHVFVGLDISAHDNPVEVLAVNPAIDLAVMPKSTGQAGCDLALTRTNGVSIASCQAALQSQNPWVIEQVLPADATLSGASMVRSADLDGNGLSDLMVVLANKKTVRVLLRQPNGTWNTSLSPFSMATNVSDVVGLQYDMDTPLELAIQTAGSARVHELNGTFVAMARNATSGAPAAMAVLPVMGSNRSRVAYLATATAGGYELHLLEYLIGPELLQVGNLVPRALLAGDHDSDGDYDLLVDRGESGIATLLLSDESVSSGCGQNPDHHFSCQLDLQLQLQVAPLEAVMQAIAWSDLDNDGRPDLLVPSSDGSYMVEFRPRVPAPEGPGPTGLPGDHPVFIQADWANCWGNAAPQLSINVNNVWLNDNRDWLQVTVWRKQNPQGGQTPGTETIGRFNGIYGRNDSHADHTLILPNVTTTGSGTNHTPFQLMSTSLASTGTDSTLYFVEVRSVQLDINNEIVSVGRKQIAGVALNEVAPDPFGTSFSYLAGLPDSWGFSVPTTAWTNGFAAIIGDGTYKIGGLVPLTTVPAFAPGFLVYTEPVIIPGP